MSTVGRQIEPPPKPEDADTERLKRIKRNWGDDA